MTWLDLQGSSTEKRLLPEQSNPPPMTRESGTGRPCSISSGCTWEEKIETGRGCPGADERILSKRSRPRRSRIEPRVVPWLGEDDPWRSTRKAPGAISTNASRRSANLVKPVRESLDKVDAKIQQVEKVREGAYSELRNQVKTMTDTQRELQQRDRDNSSKRSASPAGRGQWGEMQLRRVVEMAGMQESCDFQTQVSTTDSTRENDSGRISW